MTDEARFATAFADDVDDALATLRAHTALATIADGIARATREQLALALERGPRDLAPWRALWLAVAEVVALSGRSDSAASIRLRSFLDENADLVAPELVFDRVARYGGLALLTYAPPVPAAIVAAATADDRYTEWLFGAWAVSGVLAGVAIATRLFS